VTASEEGKGEGKVEFIFSKDSPLSTKKTVGSLLGKGFGVISLKKKKGEIKYIDKKILMTRKRRIRGIQGGIINQKRGKMLGRGAKSFTA